MVVVCDRLVESSGWGDQQSCSGHGNGHRDVRFPWRVIMFATACCATIGWMGADGKEDSHSMDGSGFSLVVWIARMVAAAPSLGSLVVFGCSEA